MIGRKRAVALSGVAVVSFGHGLEPDVVFGVRDPSRTLEPADLRAFRFADQPVPGRHRRAIVEEGRVPDDHRLAIRVADDDRELSLRRATEQSGH
jgi:hypothetical protein